MDFIFKKKEEKQVIDPKKSFIEKHIPKCSNTKRIPHFHGCRTCIHGKECVYSGILEVNPVRPTF